MDIELAFVQHCQQVDSLETMLEEGVDASLFQDVHVAEIIEFSQDYYRQSKLTQAPTIELLQEEFKDFFASQGLPEEVYVVGVLIEKLKQKYRRTQLQQVVRKVAEDLLEDPDKALIEGLQGLSQIQLDTSTANRLVDFSLMFPERVDNYFKRVLESAQDKVEHTGSVFFLDPIINNFSGGLRKPEVALFGAPPNVGKSFLLFLAALRSALAGYRVYLASLELGEAITHMRLDALWTGVPYKEYERGRLSDSEVGRLKDKLEKSDEIGGRLLVDSPRYRTERTAYELYTRAQHFGADLLVGDQLSWVTPRKSTGDKTNEMIEVFTEVIDLSREQDLASIWASQMHREVGASGRGGLRNFARTSHLEESADWAFSIARTGEMRLNNAMLLDCVKSRRTELGSWVFGWEMTEQTKIECIREYDG